MADSDIKLLLHCNGADAATSVPDSSLLNNVVTVVSGVQIDTAQSKFGGASCLFPGDDDYLTIPNNTAWNLTSTESFTIDFWVKRDGDQVDYAAILQRGDGSAPYNGWTLQFAPSGTGTNKIRLVNNADGSGGVISTDALGTDWTHVAVVHDDAGDKLYMFINGIKVDEETASTAINWTNANFDLMIGSQRGFESSREFKGWLDEVRIIKGVALWTANFTPPTTEYALTLLDSYPVANKNYDSDMQNAGRSDGQNGVTYAISNATVTHCKFYLKKTGTLTGNVVSKIYTQDGDGKPLAQVGGNSTGVDVAGISTSYGLIQFDWASNYPVLTKETNYCLLVDPSGLSAQDASNYISNGADSTGEHAGDYLYYTGSWNVAGGYDSIFYLWGSTSIAYTETFNETITLSETFKKETARIFSETLTLSEVFSKTKHVIKTFLETIFVSDTISFSLIWSKVANGIASFVKSVIHPTSWIKENPDSGTFAKETPQPGSWTKE